MKIIYNNIIPFPGYKLINLFGIVFVRKSARISNIDLNHEAIHTAQIKEFLYVFYYLWYIIEYLIRLLIYFNFHKAYKNISFEREAYENEDNLNYLNNRKHYASTKYISPRTT